MDEKDKKIAFLENLLAIMPGLIYWKDKDGFFLGCNENEADALALKSCSDIKNKTVYELMPKHEADMVTEIDKKVLKEKKAIILEEQGLDKNKNRAIYLSHKIPILDDFNHVIGLFGVSIDITEKKHAEEREKIALVEVAAANAKAKAEEEFRQAVMILSGSVAHDFRTPLAILRMIMDGINRDLPKLLEGCLAAQAAELPLENELDDRDIQILEKRLHDGVETLQELNDIIDNNLKTLSRSTLKELTKGDLAKCSSHHCLHNALTRYPLADHQRHLITHDGSYYFDFMGNDLLMIRVLTNLIKNALEQIDENKKGEIKIWSEKHDNENTIHIRDTAGGCAPEFLDKLFSGFHTTKKDGTGIGLAFCKKTLNSFGADITCYSVHGDYMEFVLVFPKI